MASLSRRSGDPAVFVAEHEAVYTVGRAGVRRAVAPGDPARWPNVTDPRHPVVELDRGGDVTYHGPGQAVVYPVLPLRKLGLTLLGYMRALEGAGVDALARCGVEAFRRDGFTGVWVRRDGEAAKIGSIGVGCRRWVTYHGMSVNVSCDLDSFSDIRSCGIEGVQVTSLAEMASRDAAVRVPSVPELGREVAVSLAGSVGIELEEAGPGFAAACLPSRGQASENRTEGLDA